MREVLTGTVLGAQVLEVSDTAALLAFLAPLQELQVPLLGVGE